MENFRLGVSNLTHKNKEDNLSAIKDYSKKFFSNHHAVSILIIGVVLGSLVVFAVPLPYSVEENYTAKVPFTFKENYTDKEPYSAKEDYVEIEPYQAQIPYVEKEPYEATETYSEQEPYTDTECHNEPLGHNEEQTVCDDSGFWNDAHISVRVNNLDTNNGGSFSIWLGFNLQTGGTTGGTFSQYIQAGSSYTFSYTSSADTNGCTYHMTSIPSKEICEQVIKYRDVQKTRTVTKYRDVTKYNTVTKYRNVTKQKDVTLYKDVTKQRDTTGYRDELTERTVTRFSTLFSRMIE